MALENKLGIKASTELARKEEKISKKKTVWLFENGILDNLEVGKFSSFQAVHKYLLRGLYNL